MLISVYIIFVNVCAHVPVILVKLYDIMPYNNYGAVQHKSFLFVNLYLN